MSRSSIKPRSSDGEVFIKTLTKYATMQTVQLSTSGEKLNKVAMGLMLMTWTNEVTPDEQAFEAIKASLDSVPPGVKMMLNSGEHDLSYSLSLFSLTQCRPGEFYGVEPKTANLELLARFFEIYPEYADKAFLSVKVRELHGWCLL